MRRWWDEFGTEDFAGDLSRTVAVLPTAAVEQHGPHLPVGVDAMINRGMLETAIGLLPEDLDVRILPVQAVGKSNEHLHAPGTLTLSAETALAAWLEIGLSVARAGVRRLVIVNSHGGNLDLISILARELRVRTGMLAVRCQWGAFGLPEGVADARERAFGIHGGEVETALMLHFRPDLVRMSAAKDFPSSAEAMEGDGFRWLRPTGTVAYGWIAKDLNREGTVGNAAAATAETGRKVAEHQARGFVDLLGEVAGVDLERFGAFMDPPPGD